MSSWQIEVVFKYAVVTRIPFDTKENAEAEYNKVAPLIGKDQFAYLKNDQQSPVHEIVSPYERSSIVLHEAVSVTVVDAESLWNLDFERRKKDRAEHFKESVAFFQDLQNAKNLVKGE